MGRKVLKLNYGGDMVNGDVNGEEDTEVLREFVIVLNWRNRFKKGTGYVWDRQEIIG